MPQKRKAPALRNVLMVMDPLEKLDLRWDNSLALAYEFYRRGTAVWTADSGDVRLEGQSVFARTSQLKIVGVHAFRTASPDQRDLGSFDLVLIRKEPPFDLNYLYLTFILEKAARKLPVVNHPRGIRNANEKLWGILHTAKTPETILSSSPEDLLHFFHGLKSAMVVKPLHDKGGRGIFLIPHGAKNAAKRLVKATSGGTQTLACQRYIQTLGSMDKRIVLLDGKVLCAFERHPSKGEFRANLGLGAAARPTRLTRAEKNLIEELAPALRREGLYLAGLDVMGEKLLEVNVTSPAGLTDAEALYPGGDFIGAWATWLSRFCA